jgi:hypothetical protein
LLNKCLPDLRAIEITGEDGGPIETITKVELIAKAHDNSSD